MRGLAGLSQVSNWAYMVMSALAWNLKSWYGGGISSRELAGMAFGGAESESQLF